MCVLMYMLGCTSANRGQCRVHRSQGHAEGIGEGKRSWERYTLFVQSCPSSSSCLHLSPLLSPSCLPFFHFLYDFPLFCINAYLLTPRDLRNKFNLFTVHGLLYLNLIFHFKVYCCEYSFNYLSISFIISSLNYRTLHRIICQNPFLLIFFPFSPLST